MMELDTKTTNLILSVAMVLVFSLLDSSKINLALNKNQVLVAGLVFVLGYIKYVIPIMKH